MTSVAKYFCVPSSLVFCSRVAGEFFFADCLRPLFRVSCTVARRERRSPPSRRAESSYNDLLFGNLNMISVSTASDLLTRVAVCCAIRLSSSLF